MSYIIKGHIEERDVEFGGQVNHYRHQMYLSSIVYGGNGTRVAYWTANKSNAKKYRREYSAAAMCESLRDHEVFSIAHGGCPIAEVEQYD